MNLLIRIRKDSQRWCCQERERQKVRSDGGIMTQPAEKSRLVDLFYRPWHESVERIATKKNQTSLLTQSLLRFGDARSFTLFSRDKVDSSLIYDAG